MWAAEYYRDTLGVVPPPGLDEAYASAGPHVASLLCTIGADPSAPPSIEWAIDHINQSSWPLADGFVPLALIDEDSIACVVVEEEHPWYGRVVRWHLTTERADDQCALYDTSADAFIGSMERELSVRQAGVDRVRNEIGPVFEAQYTDREKRPRGFVIRPVRLACQNVIVGYAAFAHDSGIAGLSVYAWQTCEVPHLATHDANRAMVVLMLCDAFKNGGTMEIRFDRSGTIKEVEVDDRKFGPFHFDGHPEKDVPASLKRYARTLGLSVGVESPGSISPAEARRLFLAVTPMPDELRERVDEAVERGVASPERLCYTLMASNMWKEIEADFILAVSDRARSILHGGASWRARAERQAEAQVCRATRMVGMLHRRLDTRDAAAADTATRVVEDSRVGVEWSVMEVAGAVMFTGVRAEPLPWQPDPSLIPSRDDPVVAIPRSIVTPEDIALVRSFQAATILPVLVVPSDAYDRTTNAVNGVSCEGIVVLVCPEPVGEMDLAIEAMLLAARMSRQ